VFTELPKERLGHVVLPKTVIAERKAQPTRCRFENGAIVVLTMTARFFFELAQRRDKFENGLSIGDHD
jgi:hypothetical protein